MKKTIEISIHISFWILYTAFVYMLCKIYLQAQPEAVFGQHLFVVVLLELIMGLIFFYITFFGIPLAQKNNRNIPVLIASLLFLIVFFAFPAFSFGFWEVMSSIIPHIIVILLAIVFRKFFDSIRLEKEKQALLLQNTQSELAMLKMQISPHFLFNTLNNIDYLISADTEKASNSMAKLGEILRYMIYDAGVEKIPLSEEINHINNYIELIRLRTSGSNYLNFKVIGQSDHLQIAPMLFLPLIENAYKHSSTKEGENIIQIEIKVDGNNIQFMIKNKSDDSVQKKMTKNNGLGLNIVKRRLELIYPQKHRFKTMQENKIYKVELNLMLDEY